MKGTVGKKDIEAGNKRVNLTLSIPEFDDLFLVAEHQKISFTSLACSWVVQRSREEAARIRKSGYIPIAQRGGDLFEGKTAPKKKANKKRSS